MAPAAIPLSWGQYFVSRTQQTPRIPNLEQRLASVTITAAEEIGQTIHKFARLQAEYIGEFLQQFALHFQHIFRVGNTGGTVNVKGGIEGTGDFIKAIVEGITDVAWVIVQIIVICFQLAFSFAVGLIQSLFVLAKVLFWISYYFIQAVFEVLCTLIPALAGLIKDILKLIFQATVGLLTALWQVSVWVLSAVWREVVIYWGICWPVVKVVLIGMALMGILGAVVAGLFALGSGGERPRERERSNERDPLNRRVRTPPYTTPFNPRPRAPETPGPSIFHYDAIPTSSTTECITCGDPLTADDRILFGGFFNRLLNKAPSCNHDWCLDCLRARFSSALRDQSLWPPSCCNKALPFQEMDLIALNLLGSEQYKLWTRKKEEYETKTPLYCPVKTCSAFIPKSNKVSSGEARIGLGGVFGSGAGPSTKRSTVTNAAVCGECGTRVCTLCSQKWHPANEACVQDKGLKEVKELAEKEMWASCPACDRIIELTQGCNHMTCLCKKEFCYVCRGDWRNASGTQNCNCRPWSVIRREKQLENLRNVISTPVRPTPPPVVRPPTPPAYVQGRRFSRAATPAAGATSAFHSRLDAYLAEGTTIRIPPPPTFFNYEEAQARIRQERENALREEIRQRREREQREREQREREQREREQRERQAREQREREEAERRERLHRRLAELRRQAEEEERERRLRREEAAREKERKANLEKLDEMRRAALALERKNQAEREERERLMKEKAERMREKVKKAREKIAKLEERTSAMQGRGTTTAIYAREILQSMRETSNAATAESSTSRSSRKKGKENVPPPRSPSTSTATGAPTRRHRRTPSPEGDEVVPLVFPSMSYSNFFASPPSVTPSTSSSRQPRVRKKTDASSFPAATLAAPCAHRGRWSHHEGVHLCSHCQQMQYKFILQCTKCQLMACVSCSKVLKKAMRGDATAGEGEAASGGAAGRGGRRSGGRAGRRGRNRARGVSTSTRE